MKAIEKSAEIQRLQQRAASALAKVRELEQRERDLIARPALRKLIGKCFVCDNSYGRGDSWPLYARIVSFNEQDLSYKAVRFQRMTDNRIEVEYEHTYNYEGKSRYGIEYGWRPISLKEYNRARRNLLKFITGLLA